MAIQKVGWLGVRLMGVGDCAGLLRRRDLRPWCAKCAPEIVEKGLKGIEKNLARLVEKGTITEAAQGRDSRAIEGHDGAGGFEGLRSGDRGDHRAIAGEARTVWRRWMRFVRRRRFLRAILRR